MIQCVTSSDLPNINLATPTPHQPMLLDKSELITKVFKDPRVKRAGRPRKDDEDDFGFALFGEVDMMRPKIRLRKIHQRCAIKLAETVVDVSEENMVEAQPRTRSGRLVRSVVDLDDEDMMDDRPLGDNGEPVKRGRGRPRKHPKVEVDVDYDENGEPIKRKRGRPRKYPEGIPKPRYSLAKLKPREFGNELSFAEMSDESDDDAKLNFIQTEPAKPNFKQLKRQGSMRNNFSQLSPFSTPKKRKHGLIDFSITELSPERKGVYRLELTPKSPNGRAGSPRSKLMMEQDKSAKNKANRQLNMLDEQDEEDVKFSERLLNDSPIKHLGGSPIKNSSPLKNTTEELDTREELDEVERIIVESRRTNDTYKLPTHDPLFKPTPLPTEADLEALFDRQYEDKALFLDGPDGYFDQHRFKLKISSNSLVMAPQLDYDQFNSLVLLSGFFHKHQREQLIQKYVSRYTEWLFELDAGMNLMFYGFGSKRLFLLRFVQECVMNRYPDAQALCVNGYNPAITLLEILRQLCSVLKLRSAKTTSDIVQSLVSHFAPRDHKVECIVLIHNIDGQALRDEKTQGYFSQIAAIRQIRFITSMDHVYAPVLWNSPRLANFDFAWHDVTNFTDYLTELSFRDALTFGQMKKSSGSKGAKYVLSSLTAKSRDLYRTLAVNQLVLMKEDQYDEGVRGAEKHAMQFTRLFQLCAEQFISSNQINFRTMFMEFVEHKMAVLMKNSAGTEIVYIPFMMDEIEQLVEEEL